MFIRKTETIALLPALYARRGSHYWHYSLHILTWCWYWRATRERFTYPNKQFV
jgi:hypothetical protein